MQTKKRVFDEVEAKPDLPALERRVMELWEREGTYQASLERRRDRPRWVFYEGPPTANGRPGFHHILARAFKDVFPRYRTMKGYLVERKAGWDTHGLPVELEVEKKLGISGKQQIEEFGIDRFNELCRQSVYEYVDAWTEMSKRMAFWQDYDDAYWTLDSDYIQSVWWALKTMWDRGLIYKGFRVAPYCPRCMTPLSSHELAQGYKDDVPDPSVYVRFRLRSDPGTSVLAWTTTPWTLPGNVALAVGEDIDYVEVEQGSPSGTGERLILAEARLDALEGEYRVVRRLKGSELVGLDYEPLYTYLPPKERAWYIVSADFVSVDEGTGVVHTAAAYGADDLRLCQEKGIPVRHTVDLRGRFLPEVGKFAGMPVREANPLVIDDLRERGLLYKAVEIRHTYPFCWRCDTALIYYALDSWYLRTTAVRDQLVANNEATNWIPAHVKTGRMGDWLENNVDWAFSRSRYWGTPLPFWVCAACGAQRCVASAEELGLDPESDLHRPYIDTVRLPCDCGGQMERVPEVLDCWFDSGAMPFAQRGHPRKGRELFEATFPADFISEAMDQTRGWFYSLLAEATILFGQNAYRNVICLGMVLDAQGKKASKSRGNAMDPAHVFDTFGADAVRWIFFTQPVGENYRIGEGPLQQVVRQLLLPLWNVYSFFVTYANIDGVAVADQPPVPLAERPVLDRWLLSRLSDLVDTVDRGLERYDVNAAARPIQEFVGDLSNWYVRRSRRRFWKAGSDTDKLAAHQTLYETLVVLTRLMAPFTPFVADAIHRNLRGGESVHLTDFPVAVEQARDRALEEEMAEARTAVQAGMSRRDEARIKVRQPLPAFTVTHELLPEVAAIVREELNVKELRLGSELALDTTITEELRVEGMARDAVRMVQDLRKRSGLAIENRIRLHHEGGPDWARVFERFGDTIAAETLAVEVRAGRADGLDGEVEGGGLWIGLKRA
jgi:isoleucyl-tRNA synthetase